MAIGSLPLANCQIFQNRCAESVAWSLDNSEAAQAHVPVPMAEPEQASGLQSEAGLSLPSSSLVATGVEKKTGKLIDAAIP